MNWWLLPGPESFLNQAVDALREGQNLILARPTFTAVGLHTILEYKLHDEGWRLAEHITDDTTDPLDQLFLKLVLDDQGAPRRSVALLRQCLKAGEIVLVSGVGTSGWPAWKQLLAEYEIASRGVSVFDRPLLIVITEGVALSQLPPRAVALKVFPWNNVVGELDILLYANQVFRERCTLNVRTKLVARMIARLALWDFALADYLLDQDTIHLFRPDAIIQRACDVLGYPTGMTQSWESGGLQHFDNVEMLHPFVLVSQGDLEADLVMRVWAAQASEILPAIELHRRELAKRMRSMVSVPMSIGDEQISDIDDLEIGQLAHVARICRLSPSIQQKAEKWRKLRNKLAHLEPLSADEALDSDIFRNGQ